MEATTSAATPASTGTDASYRPLDFATAFVRQFGLLWTSRRPLVMAVALLALLVLAGEPWTDDAKMRLLTFWPLWLVLIGPVWAFSVFHNEGPSQRLYFWSLPVSRTRHTLARVAAGLAWLWIMYGVLIGAGALIAAMDGDLWQMGELSTAGWLNFFTGPLLGYLAVSVLTVASDYPLRWFFGILFVIPLTLSILVDWLGLRSLAETLLEPLASPDWGLLPVMVGGLGTTVNDLEHTLMAMAGADGVARGGPDVAYWWTATPAWILLFVALLTLVASRHPDSLPRLRRSG